MVKVEVVNYVVCSVPVRAYEGVKRTPYGVTTNDSLSHLTTITFRN